MSAPTIYVDVIEDQPLSILDWAREHPGVDEDDRDPDRLDVVRAAYANYVDRFQPWRILVLSGDNHEPLFRSTERYFNLEDAKRAIDIAFGPNSNVFLRQAEHGNVELRLASDAPQ